MMAWDGKRERCSVRVLVDSLGLYQELCVKDSIGKCADCGAEVCEKHAEQANGQIWCELCAPVRF